MKNFIYTAFFFLLIAGCKPGIPSDIIQPDKMALVLNDIHIVDAYITTIPNADTSKGIAASYYNGIYKKYDIDSGLYAKSMQYYSIHPKILDEIYDKVTKGLTKQKDVLVRADSLANAKEQKKLKAKMKADSLKKAIASRKADSLKKIETARKNKALLRKANRKKRADSLKLKELLKKTTNKK